MPIVSVIIPTYNSANYIEETVQSVFAQIYTDYEVIVINDGSTDHTLDILEKYKDRLTVLTKSNGGPASARNEGIRESNGQFIAFLDADDIWKPNKLELQVAFMQQNRDIGYCYANAECFSVTKDGNRVHRRDLICSISGMVFREQFWSNFIVNSTVMVRRTCLDEIGLLDESKKLIGAEDYDLWLRLNRKFALGNIAVILAEYRLREDSLVGESYEKAFHKHVFIYNKFYSQYKDTQERVSLTHNQAIGDLHLRYAYKNFISSQYYLAINKAVFSIRYTPIRGAVATCLYALRIRQKRIWRKLITNFDLWHQISGETW